MGELAGAIAAIRAGGVVGLPTDTVYALAADPEHPDAVEAVFELKHRAGSAPLVILAATLTAAQRWGRLEEESRAAAQRHWPGPLTVVVEAVRSLPDGVGDSARQSIGLRVPDHDVARRLLAATGPLAVTSANRSGQSPAMNDREARRIFGDEVATYIEGQCPGEDGSGLSTSGKAASTVVDYTRQPPAVLRQGPVQV